MSLCKHMTKTSMVNEQQGYSFLLPPPAHKMKVTKATGVTGIPVTWFFLCTFLYHLYFGIIFACVSVSMLNGPDLRKLAVM